MIWVKTRHSLDLPELRQSTPSRSATNGEDDPPMQSVGTSRRVDGRSTDAFDVYRRAVFGMAARRITELDSFVRPGIREHSPARV